MSNFYARICSYLLDYGLLFTSSRYSQHFCIWTNKQWEDLYNDWNNWVCSGWYIWLYQQGNVLKMFTVYFCLDYVFTPASRRLLYIRNICYLCSMWREPLFWNSQQLRYTMKRLEISWAQIILHLGYVMTLRWVPLSFKPLVMSRHHLKLFHPLPPIWSYTISPERNYCRKNYRGGFKGPDPFEGAALNVWR